ncbi:general stress protein [Paenibacillus alkaliterrae]|uniref:general stress protein n=1 Tax=Paenibacillus alkaliterrae TaxID=320909 RepID=UPI001F381574|nr:general stress protein [Paenibacillus alkaliterrae]MCF2939214.1 general stress protein [Paenibacillus alkaliterrae]
MARKIGIFETEQQAITAIRQLEQAGFVPGELQVLAKDSEHSRRIEAESGVHADELRELAESSDADRGIGVFGMEAAGYGGMAVAPAYGMSGSGMPSYFGGAYPFAAAALGNDYGHADALQSLGLDQEEAEICSKSLQGGAVIVIVQTDESKSLLDKEDGPDLSRLSAAEAVFRQCNASVITAGA